MPEREDSTAAASAVRRVGTTIRGKYHLDRLLGIGGMAAVYAATHRNGRRYALKILHADTNGDARRRFFREAKLANRVTHEGAIHVIDEDVGEEGCPFLVLPLLEGETLRARWERKDHRLPLDEVVWFAWLVLDVLASAHAKSVVHRDIKPENIFLTIDGELRILDFGIARIWTGTDATVSRTGTITGTPAFMAPEQVLGRVGEIDGRTDLWAVGATMFTLLSGRYVHEGVTQNEILVSAGSRPAPDLGDIAPSVPPEICAFVKRALAFDVVARWPDAATMRAALDACTTQLFHVGAPALSELLRSDPSRRPTALEPGAPISEGLSPTAEPGTTSARSPNTWWSATISRALNVAVTRTTPLEPLSKSAMRYAASTRARVTIVAGSVLLTLLGAAAWKRRTQTPAPTASMATDLNTYLANSRAAWFDGDAARAREDAGKALALDASSARANLAFVVATPFWLDDATRGHFMRADQFRYELSAREAAYLDAIAPEMTVPPNFRLAIDRLTPLLESDPRDDVVRLSLADTRLRTGDLDGAASLLRPLVDRTSPGGLPLARFGNVAALRDDVDTARVYLNRCLDSHPGSSVCASTLAGLEMNEGRCVDAERLLRRWLSVAPGPTAYLDLGYVLQRQGAPPEEIAPVLNNWVKTSDESARELASARADVRIRLMGGDLRGALSIYPRIESLLRNVADDGEHFDYTGYRMLLEAELGDQDAAALTLSKYVSDRQAFQRRVDGGDNVTYLLALGVEFGFYPWSDWVKRRDQHLAEDRSAEAQLAGNGRSWLQHFAMPAVTKEAAAEALARLPEFLPILERSDRWYWQDGAIGRVYALLGQDREALPYYERAVASCGALEDLVQYHRTEIELADFYLRTGNPERACQTYARVVISWPLESGSVTSRHAQEQFNLHCHSPQKENTK
jgi:serine/threonine protein kinase/tetratricopeptide (TPR) repeat protein